MKLQTGFKKPTERKNILLADGSDDTSLEALATKALLEEDIKNYLPLSGGTITGQLYLTGLEEGTADITDNTELLTSIASNNGFSDSNAIGKVYKRDVVHVYNYIKNKLDSVYLSLSGGALTGNLSLKADLYNRQGALNCNNSDIIGVNSLYTSNLANNTAEGIRFYRDASHWDSLTASGGNLYFMPNDTDSGTSFASANLIYHTGNLSPMTTSHAANGITADNISNWNSVYDWYSVAADSDGVNDAINTWKEVEAFLTGVTDLLTLTGLLSTRVAKSGDTMTGDLTVTGINFLDADGLKPVLKIGSSNVDTTIWRVYSNGSEYDLNSSIYGYSLKYLGTGSGNDNKLVLIADNLTGTRVTAVSITQDGVVTLSKTPTVNGTAVSLNSHTHSYLPLSGGTLTGTLGKSSNYIFKPNGGDYRTIVAAHTGAICISFPTNIDSTMVSLWIDVYNYLPNTSFSVHVGGYMLNDTTVINNAFAMVYGATHKVRLTYSDGLKIYIGETTSTWLYPQISVRDVLIGFSPNYSNWCNDWNISFVTSFPTINTEISRYVLSSDNYSTLVSPKTHTHSVSINGVTKTIESTGGNAVDLGSYLPLSGGTIIGNLILYSSSVDSPHLTFQRGNPSDGAFGWDQFTTSGCFKIRYNNTETGTEILSLYPGNNLLEGHTILTAGNSSISGGGSSWGSSITVKINGTSKTLTIPSNPNTDSLVKQSQTTTSNFRPLLMGYTQASAADATLEADVTNLSYVSSKFYAKPSTGELYSTKFVGNLTGTASNVTVNSLESNNNYNLLFHSSNTIYKSSGVSVLVNPSTGNITAGHFYANSDVRYKNITDYYCNLSSKIALLPIFKYTWINREDPNQHIGSSALSVMGIIPELVTYDDKTDFYSLDYATLGAVAGISACREVETLKLKIKDLEQEIIFLKSKYNG